MKNFVLNYYKPTPKCIRKFGDSLLTASLLALPYVAQDSKLASWFVGTCVIGKFLTNLFSVDDNAKGDNDVSNPNST